MGVQDLELEIVQEDGIYRQGQEEPEYSQGDDEAEVLGFQDARATFGHLCPPSEKKGRSPGPSLSPGRALRAGRSFRRPSGD